MGSIDSNYLFDLARQNSEEGRAELAETISDLFHDEGNKLSDRERSLMFDILHRVVHDVEMSVRKNVSARLAEIGDVPRDLALFLANETIDVAYPILTLSTVLEDTDLIEVIRNRTMEHQLAVAIRASVSEGVSDVLVEVGSEDVIRTLLANHNADISKGTMEYLVEQSKRHDSFQEPILTREDLDPVLAKRMYLWVSAALRQHIIKTFDFDHRTVDDMLESAALEEIRAVATAERKPRGTQLAQKLDIGGMISTDMLLTALQDGEVTLFVAMFRQWTGLREDVVMRMLFEGGGQGLAIACKAMGMDAAALASIFALCRKTRPAEERYIKRELRKMLTLFERMTREAAEEVVALWRRDRDYLSAIRELELGEKTDGRT